MNIFLLHMLIVAMIILACRCTSVDPIDDFLQSLNSPNCVLTEKNLLAFFSTFSPNKENDESYLQAVYLLDLRISAKKEYISKIFHPTTKKSNLFGHYLIMAKPKGIFKDDEVACMALKKAVPQFTIHSIPEKQLWDISLLSQAPLAFLAATLPSMLLCPTAEKAYFSLKDLFFIQEPPYVPKGTMELLGPEGIAPFLAGFAHPEAYHCIKPEHFSIIFDAMAKHSESYILDTMFIWFRHHISFGKNHSGEMSSTAVMNVLSEHESAESLEGIASANRMGDSDAVSSILLYLVHEARREEGLSCEDFVGIPYPGHRILFDRLQYLRNCSKNPFIGPSILLLLNRLTRFDIVQNPQLEAALTKDDVPALAFAHFERIFSDDKIPNDDGAATTSVRKALIEFLFQNSATFIPFSEKSATFTLLQYTMLSETEEEVFRILSTYLTITSDDSQELQQMIKKLSCLFIFIVYKYEHQMSPPVFSVVKNWLISSAPMLFLPDAPILLKNINANSAAVFHRSMVATISSIFAIMVIAVV